MKKLVMTGLLLAYGAWAIAADDYPWVMNHEGHAGMADHQSMMGHEYSAMQDQGHSCEEEEHSSMRDQEDHCAGSGHSAMMGQGHHQFGAGRQGLTEAGNDAFGTIQEVIRQLNQDPDTDWRQVNLEALRRHLLDMNDMTLQVEVLSQKTIDHGMEAVIRPTTVRAAQALDRIFLAHPAELQKDTGWAMQVVKKQGQYTLTTTSEIAEEAIKIRGLGYIGWMAYGDHHQQHHWAMATGKDPHQQHH